MKRQVQSIRFCASVSRFKPDWTQVGSGGFHFPVACWFLLCALSGL
jgi:hypothetical protein